MISKMTPDSFSDELIAADDLPSDAEVLSEIEVLTERLEGRQRQISAAIVIPRPVEQVWQVLTDYDRLADFIPNLSQSRRIPHPASGTRIEQIGAETFLKLKFCARVVLDMVEQSPTALQFRMVEGDFKEFSGQWTLEPIEVGDRPGTYLGYSVLVLPPRTMPIGIIERKLKHGLVMNLAAIQQRVETLFS